MVCIYFCHGSNLILGVLRRKNRGCVNFRKKVFIFFAHQISERPMRILHPRDVGQFDIVREAAFSCRVYGGVLFNFSRRRPRKPLSFERDRMKSFPSRSSSCPNFSPHSSLVRLQRIVQPESFRVARMQTFSL